MEYTTYEITEALDPSFVGITFEVPEGEDPSEYAIQAIDSAGYAEWCDENGHVSYDFEFDEM